ncbi:hypothetical protein AB9E26_36500, partial [Rhizobium leguminosarum]
SASIVAKLEPGVMLTIGECNGDIFAHDIRAQGVHYQTRPKGTFPPTARSMIFVTEDGERSMNTYLGACVGLDILRTELEA